MGKSIVKAYLTTFFSCSEYPFSSDLHESVVYLIGDAVRALDDYPDIFQFMEAIGSFLS